jgi:hypothetical protein
MRCASERSQTLAAFTEIHVVPAEEHPRLRGAVALLLRQPSPRRWLHKNLRAPVLGTTQVRSSSFNQV